MALRTICVLAPVALGIAAASDAEFANEPALSSQPFSASWESLMTNSGDVFADFGASSNGPLRGPPNPLSKKIKTQIVARDGVKLQTHVVIPFPAAKKRPTVLCGSPYGPFTVWMAELYRGLGFVAVMQRDRGTFASGGDYSMMRSDASDGAVTLEWITKQPWSNGQVYSVGASADGMGEIALILEEPKVLLGQWWVVTTGQGHDFIYPQGMYRQDLIENYMKFLSPISHGVTKHKAIPDVRAHEAWSDWWYNITVCRNGSDCHYSKVKWPVISTGGWWDLFAQQQVDDFHGIREHSDPAVRSKHVLVMGPLGHCAGDFRKMGSRSALEASTMESMMVSFKLSGEFFRGDYSGKTRSRLGRINLFVMNHYDAIARPLARNWWTSLDDWPAFKTKTLYLQQGKALKAQPTSTSGSEAYDYDPAKPTPMEGGANLPPITKTRGCGTADQSHRERRSDVIVFNSEVLTEDMPVVGRLSARLYVSSTRNDTDFVVTVSDYKPGIFGSSFGEKSMLVRYGAIRMRWRDSDANMSSPMLPGKIYAVDIDLMTTAYIFPKGHQVRVAVSSAAAPFYNPNHNTGKSEVSDEHQPRLKATNSVHFSTEHPSSISIPVVKMADIPRNHHFGSVIGQEVEIEQNTPQIVV